MDRAESCNFYFYKNCEKDLLTTLIDNQDKKNKTKKTKNKTKEDVEALSFSKRNHPLDHLIEEHKTLL